jgi:hypothetical protein
MEARLATSSYGGWAPRQGMAAVAISVGKPKFPLRYEIAGEIDELKPFGLLGIEDEHEFETAYRARLDRVGVERLREIFDETARDTGASTLVLCCFEKDPAECHRRQFAAFWKEQTGEEIPELAPRRRS